jgi:hypothetical protein
MESQPKIVNVLSSQPYKALMLISYEIRERLGVNQVLSIRS